MGEDAEARDDELLALASIYDDSVFTSSQGDTIEAQFCARLELPPGFTVSQTNKDGAVKQHRVSHLPPIMLHFRIPSDYPSCSPPSFTLVCNWLQTPQLSRLCGRLDEIWEEQRGGVVLYEWIHFITEESLVYLGVDSHLTLSPVSSSSHRPLTKIKPPPGLVKKEDLTLDKLHESMATTRDSEVTKNPDSPLIENNKDHDSPQDPDSRAVQDIASSDLLLPAILEYDCAQKEALFSASLCSCAVCFLERVGSQCIRFPGCAHVYCKSCMRGYFEVQIEEGAVLALTCPSDQCRSQAHPAQVKELVSGSVYERYERLLLQSSLDTMGDVVYCPRPACGCGVLVDSALNMASCPACYHVFCVFCKRAYHGVSPCRIQADEVRHLRELYLAGDDVEKKRLERRYGRQIRHVIEDSYSSDWLDEYSKKCPHCSTNIQKIDGCNKMSCTKCRSFFCWLCLTRLHHNNPYLHFSDPTSPCFNQLFAGLDPGEHEQYEDPDWDPLLL